MNKGRFLLYILYAAGCVGLGVFVITKNEHLMYKVTEAMYNDGDLYRFAKVRHFKVPTPVDEYANEEAAPVVLDTFSVFMIGDSFIETSRGHKPLRLQLSEALRRPVFAVQAGDSTEYFNPMYLFKKEHVSNSRPRVVVLERVERYIINDFADELDENPEVDSQTVAPEGAFRWDVFERRWFTDAEKNYEIFLTSSFFTSPLVELWNTGCFSALGRISDKTPVYSLNPPFLFYDEEVSRKNTTGFYYPHPDSLVAQIADNIAAIRERLRERYNTELVFMPVPNAYTLYHKFVNADTYDDFVPRLEIELGKRGVGTVKLYTKFFESDRVLYFPTDSHWNAAGVAIALDQTLDQLHGLEHFIH